MCDYTGASCLTDGSKTSKGVGSGVVVDALIDEETIHHEKSYHLNEQCTVFQAEVHAMGEAATFLLERNVSDLNILINCDSQAAIRARAVNSTIIRESTTLETARKLNDLVKSNRVFLRWIPAHRGHVGNERADTLAKNGANKSDESILVKLPIPRAVCYAALKRKTRAEWNRTGHACLNYHLSKINREIAPTCSLCQEESETGEHVLVKCLLLWELSTESRILRFSVHYGKGYCRTPLNNTHRQLPSQVRPTQNLKSKMMMCNQEPP